MARATTAAASAGSPSTRTKDGGSPPRIRAQKNAHVPVANRRLVRVEPACQDLDPRAEDVVHHGRPRLRGHNPESSAGRRARGPPPPAS